jgi:hypothetical protein
VIDIVSQAFRRGSPKFFGDLTHLDRQLVNFPILVVEHTAAYHLDLGIHIAAAANPITPSP